MDLLSSNPSISMEFVETHPTWRWSAEGLSKNLNITPKFVERHLDWKWDMDGLSQNTFKKAVDDYARKQQQLRKALVASIIGNVCSTNPLVGSLPALVNSMTW